VRIKVRIKGSRNNIEQSCKLLWLNALETVNGDDLVFHARLGEAPGGRCPPVRAAAFGMPFPFFQSMRTMPVV
jgi:hypothetical protein